MKGERAAERLRQERETFEVRKTQSRWWFGLRFATGTTLLLIAIGVFTIAAVILLFPTDYPPAVVQGSGVAMMLDLLAIGGTALTALIKPTSQPNLGPVTGNTDAD